MPGTTELSTADLRTAGDAIETVIEFRDYLPPGGMLLMLAGRWRDEIRELLAMPTLDRVSRGPDHKRLSTMDDADLYRLAEAVILLVGAFTGSMDDPELPRQLKDLLGSIVFARSARAGVEEAKAS
jgi:hypothetical protein